MIKKYIKIIRNHLKIKTNEKITTLFLPVVVADQLCLAQENYTYLKGQQFPFNGEFKGSVVVGVENPAWIRIYSFSSSLVKQQQVMGVY